MDHCARETARKAPGRSRIGPCSVQSFVRLRRLSAAALSGLWLWACGGDDGAASSNGSGGSGGGDAGAADSGGHAGADAAAPTLAEALDAEGFDTQPGELSPVDLSNCCDEGRSCSGNNPSSPYLAAYLPRGPGQTAENFDERPDGTSSGVRLRQDEVVVLLGETPPAVKYFGFTPYLLDRDYAGERRMPFASLSETLNHEVVRTTGETYGAEIAILLASNADSEARARAALVAAGVPDGAINTLVLDGAVLRLGLEQSADTLGLLGRVAFFDDEAAGTSWVASPGFEVLRATPREELSANPLPAPQPREKGSTSERDSDLSAALDRLEQAVLATTAGATVRQMSSSIASLVPEACIANGSPCLGDNRDAVYPNLGSEAFVVAGGDSLWVLGVDHVETGKATYASASVYALEHLFGVVAVSSEQWEGSAERFLPGDPDASSLFAWRFARTCGSDEYCTEIPTGTCPSGAGLLQALTLAFRVYVEPGYATAPNPDTLVPERVLHVRP